MAEQITRNIIVNADVAHVYELWTRFEEFPLFMKHIESVTRTGPWTTHWVMKDPSGRRLEWDAETTRLEPNKRIAWNSHDGGDIKTSGQVLFNELPNGQTAITATVQYVAGGVLETLAKLFHQAESVLESDLQQFKEVAEASAGRARAGTRS
jgi:uncharacterized membrane protein